MALKVDPFLGGSFSALMLSMTMTETGGSSAFSFFFTSLLVTSCNLKNSLCLDKFLAQHKNDLEDQNYMVSV